MWAQIVKLQLGKKLKEEKGYTLTKQSHTLYFNRLFVKV